MAAMLAAAVVTAGVTSLAVRMVMVVTVNIGIVVQTSAEQSLHRCVSVPADTAVELDARFGQSCLRTAADASANQSVHTVLHQEACQCAVTAAVGINDFRMDDFAVRSFINLELFSVAEMLKNLTVFIGNCNFHNGISFAIFVGFFCVGSQHPAAAAAVGCLPSSADQSVHTVLHQEACQCAVTAAVGVNDFRMSDFAVRSFIKLELLGVTEMLKI